MEMASSQLQNLKLPLSGKLFFGLPPLSPVEAASSTDWLSGKS